MSFPATAPVIQTARLALYPHAMSDFDIFWRFYQSGRAQYMDVPKTRTDAWYGFASEVGSWPLMGHGGWAITLNGQIIGQVAITQPPHFPELELGWMIFDAAHEGKGYAFEAATAARDYAFDILGADTLVSYIDRDNARSIALAKRLGAVEDAQAKRFDDVDLVFRHAAQPAPDDTQDGGMEAYA